MTDKLNEPAFPRPYVSDPTKQYEAADFGCYGISLRVYAAIQLRVPDSGIPELDAMILEARKLDWAGMALQALITNGNIPTDDIRVAKVALEYGHAMLSQIACHAKQT